jgi:hypothetical protein
MNLKYIVKDANVSIFSIINLNGQKTKTTKRLFFKNLLRQITNKLQ